MAHCLSCGDLKCIARSADYASIVCMCGGKCSSTYDCVYRPLVGSFVQTLQRWGFFLGATAYAPRWAFLIALLDHQGSARYLSWRAQAAMLAQAKNDAVFRDAICAVADMAGPDLREGCRSIAEMFRSQEGLA